MATPSTSFENIPTSKSLQQAYDKAIENGDYSLANTIITLHDILKMLNPAQIKSYTKLEEILDSAMLICYRRAKDEINFR
jgi:hypothetical protein